MRKAKNIMIFANPNSTLAIERARIPAEAGYKVFWFNFAEPRSVRLRECNWLSGLIVPPQLRRGNRPISAMTLYWTFLRLQPCIAHVHYALTSWPSAKWIGQLHPLIVSVMGGDIMPDQGFHGAHVEPTRYLLDQADVITTKSDFMDQRLGEIGHYEDKLRRITWGMDMNIFRPGLDVQALRAKWDLREDEIVLFCARVCEPRTNKLLVIEAFTKALPHLDRPAKLLISEYLGDAEYCRHMHVRVKELGVSKHVRFVGEIPLAEMPGYLNLADAVLSVAQSDGMPQTLYQAMSCGSYPIISDIPQTRELLDLGCRLSLADVNDLESLTRRVIWFCANKEQAASMAAQNRNLIRAVADKVIQDKALITTYEELFAQRRAKKSGL